MTDGAILRIALSLNIQFGYSRETLRGIMEAAMPHQGFGKVSAGLPRGDRQWRFQLFSRLDDPFGHRQEREITSFAPQGIIYENLRMGKVEKPCRTLRNIVEQIPGHRVELYPFGERPKWPAFSSDDVAVGRMAAEHFLGMGLRHFAYFGDQYHDYSRLRRSGFEDALNLASPSPGRAKLPSVAVPCYDRGPDDWRRGLRAWLKDLPLPVGILAANDLFATELMEELAQTDWKVPEEIAVLGVDNDDLLCNLAYPRISSVVPGFRQVGRAAVGLLSQLLAGQQRGPSEILVPPLRVVPRQSTDILHVSDAQVATAVRYIRSHALDNISVKELVQKVPGNRRRLEKKFFDLIGRTPLEEIHRVRIARAKILLLEGKNVEQVAYEMHFSSPKYFATLFRRVAGLTASEFRLLDYQSLIGKSLKAGPTRPPAKHRAEQRADFGVGG